MHSFCASLYLYFSMCMRTVSVTFAMSLIPVHAHLNVHAACPVARRMPPSAIAGGRPDLSAPSVALFSVLLDAILAMSHCMHSFCASSYLYVSSDQPKLGCSYDFVRRSYDRDESFV